MGRKVLLLLVLGIFLIGIVSAGTFCCEKTKTGAWCQNVNAESECDITSINPATITSSNPAGEPFKSTNAFCESTEFCSSGTCVNSREGTCTTSPKSVCVGNGGFWSEQSKSELEQCQLGCCLIGDQAAFTTQITCNKLSNDYGLKINWQRNINDEFTCLASASPKTKGACVFTKSYVKTCLATTKEKCQNEIAKNSAYSNVEFHAGYLCSSQELETNCAKSKNTICDDNEDVRFIDTCGNLANIYDSGKLNSSPYWTYIAGTKEGVVVDCKDGEGNKGSKSCGDCDYFSGSICKKKKAGESVNYGEYICRNLDCVNYHDGFEDRTPNYARHGESWCVSSQEDVKITGVRDERGDIVSFSGGEDHTQNNLPGNQFFRLRCSQGEVIVEDCDISCKGGRCRVCAESVIGGEETNWRNGQCVTNLWESCILQTNKTDCEDRELRYCKWVQEGFYFSSSNGLVKNTAEENLEIEDTSGSEAGGACVPLYPPGFDRTSEDDAANGNNICSLASSRCIVSYELGLFELKVFGSEEAKWDEIKKMSRSERLDLCEKGETEKEEGDNNCECLESSWQSNINYISTALGDCGNKKNYIGINGKQAEPISSVEIETE